MLTLLHEVGHALGLSHPGDYDFDPDNPDDAPTYEEDAEYLEDSNQYTVMSYFAAEYTGALHETVQGIVYAQTPLLHDIYAIQQIYGTNLTTRAGDTVYGYNSTADRDVFDFDLNSVPGDRDLGRRRHRHAGPVRGPKPRPARSGGGRLQRRRRPDQERRHRLQDATSRTPSAATATIRSSATSSRTPCVVVTGTTSSTESSPTSGSAMPGRAPRVRA